MRKREGAETDVAHLLKLPHLGGTRILGAHVVLIARCSRTEEHWCIMIVGAVSVAEEGMAHEAHGGSAKSRTLFGGERERSQRGSETETIRSRERTVFLVKASSVSLRKSIAHCSGGRV